MMLHSPIVLPSVDLPALTSSCLKRIVRAAPGPAALSSRLMLRTSEIRRLLIGREIFEKTK